MNTLHIPFLRTLCCVAGSIAFSVAVAADIFPKGAKQLLSEDFKAYTNDWDLDGTGRYQRMGYKGGSVGVNASLQALIQSNESVNPEGAFTRFRDVGSVDTTRYSAASFSFDIGLTDPSADGQSAEVSVGLGVTSQAFFDSEQNNTYLGNNKRVDRQLLNDHVGFGSGTKRVSLVLNWGSQPIRLSDESALPAGQFMFFVDNVLKESGLIDRQLMREHGGRIGVNLFTFQNQIGNYVFDRYVVRAVR